MGAIDEKVSDVSLTLYALTYLSFYFLVLSYQIKKHLYKLDLDIQEILSENEFQTNAGCVFVIIFGTFTTLVLLSLINYNIDYNNSYNVGICIYAFICSFIIILDNTYRSYVIIKENLF
jgi:hypothetical protein